jgi:hypothetical protein
MEGGAIGFGYIFNSLMLVLVSTSGGRPHHQQMGKNVLSSFEIFVVKL